MVERLIHRFDTRPLPSDSLPSETGSPEKEPRLFRVESDPEFREYFQELRQVFLYVTDDCNLACRQCLYKPWLRQGNEFELAVATSLLTEFRTMGANKLSILGGEPTRYKNLPLLIRKAKEIGCQYVRLDTNGQFDQKLLSQSGFQELDELTFSLDAHTPEINDPLRGRGTFQKCVSNMHEAIRLGYNVNITCCVHRGNIGKDEKGQYFIEHMIRFASSVGVQRINFHPLFRMGVPRDTWAGETDIPPLEWRHLYDEIQRRVEDSKYNIPVRIPQRFIERKEFEENPAYYGYCPVKMGERVLVHPNGQIQICVLMIGTPVSIAKFEVLDDRIKIIWQRESNELEEGNFDLTTPTPCTNQVRDFGDFVRLCISFKPKQKEFIWEELDKGWVLKFKKGTRAS